MKKPTNYNPNVNLGDFTPVELGGHQCFIVGVKEEQSKSGQPMLKVAIDFAKEDRQAGYMLKAFNEDTREDKKWPASGTCYIMENAYDYDNACFTDNISKACNDFLASVVQSNPGFVVNFDTEDFGKQFKGKLVGAVYREEENEWNGKTTMLHKIMYFCQYEKAPSKGIPKAKMLKGTKTRAASVPSEKTEEEVPF